MDAMKIVLALTSLVLRAGALAGGVYLVVAGHPWMSAFCFILVLTSGVSDSDTKVLRLTIAVNTLLENAALHQRFWEQQSATLSESSQILATSNAQAISKAKHLMREY